jgi:Domain of unknown function (DUF4397)
LNKFINHKKEMYFMRSEKKSLLIMVLPLAACVVCLSVACSKSNNNTGSGGTTNTGTAYVAVVDASPTTSMYSVYGNSTNLTQSSQIGYGSATGEAGGSPYINFVPGDSIKLTSNGSTYAIDSNYGFVNMGYYTMFVYDTANSSGQLKTLVLNDPSAAPTTGQAEVRFINLSSNSAALFVSFINGTDTIRQSNIGYAGTGLVSADSLSNFTSIAPGTYDVQVSNSEGSVLTDGGSHSFLANGVYTLYAKGYTGGLNGTDSLSVGVIQNR